MPSIYKDGQVNYAKNTEVLSKFYPPWMQIRRNKESIGHQFLNAFGLELDEVESFINEALNNQYIGTANVKEIYEIYKFSIYDIDEDSDLGKIKGEIDGASMELTESVSLRQFYEDSDAGETPDNIIFDFENSLCYLRKKYDKVTILGNEYYSIRYHHVWNVFDEFALSRGLRRRYFENEIESNTDLKERTLNVFKFPANSQYIGLINGIGQSLGLINTEKWKNQEDTFSILGQNVERETILLNGEPLQDGQWVDESGVIELVPKINIFPRSDFEYRVSNVEMANNQFRLTPGAKEGSFITPFLHASNLSTWKDIETEYSGDVTIEVFPFSSNSLLDSYKHYEGSPNALLPEEVGHPIMIKFTLKRKFKSDSSPTVSKCAISYRHKTSEVKYIHSLQIDSMHDKSFRSKELFSNDGSPTLEMKRYAQELSEVSPILWDSFKWDEAYWDVVDENLMGLEALPHRWDPKLGLKSNSYLKRGIGFGNDLRLRPSDSDWNLCVHNGYYYVGENAQEYFLHANSGEAAGQETDSIDLPGHINQGAPVIVIADEKYLTQVSFLDEDYNFTITNTETLVADDEGHFYLSYANPDNVKASVQGSVSILGENKVALVPKVSAGTEVTFTYRVKDSFVITNSNQILLSDSYQNVKVVYEKEESSAFRKINSIDLSPTISHISSGFIYLTDTVEDPYSLVASAHPDFLRADGHDASTITIDVFDRWGNPVIEDIEVQGLDQDGSKGTIEKTAQSYNRSIFRYVAPAEPQDITLVFSTTNQVSTSTILKVR